ncbi:MAG TPA: hypothetical protein VGM41_07415 [Chitinophagaceae bacterium]
MFNNIAFDVVIGLIFVYLLYSLLTTILQEILAHLLNLRSRMLNKAIRRMLEDEKVKNEGDWEKYSMLTWFYTTWNSLRRFFRPNRENETFIQLFYEQPAIKYLGESKHNNKPSYLDANNFSSTIVQLLRGPDYDGSSQNEASLIKKTLDDNSLKVAALFRKPIRKEKEEDSIHIPPEIFAHLRSFFRKRSRRRKDKGSIKIPPRTLTILQDLVSKPIPKGNDGDSILIPPETLAHLQNLFRDSRQDPFLFRKKLEDWFQQTMDRASGWYKKQTQVMLFLLGLILSISFNVDTIAICRVLSKDKEARQQLVNMAIQKNTDLQAAVNAAKNKQDSDDVLYKTYKDLNGDTNKANDILGLGNKQDPGFLSAIGILLTALAISLGSPFWFDLLNKFIQLRGTGPKPDPTPAKTSGAAGGSGTMPLTTPDGNQIRG